MSTLSKILVAAAGLLVSTNGWPQVNAGECDAAARVATVALGLSLIAVGESPEGKAKALALTNDVEVVLQRSCGLTAEQAHTVALSLLRDVASGMAGKPIK